MGIRPRFSRVLPAAAGAVLLWACASKPAPVPPRAPTPPPDDVESIIGPLTKYFALDPAQQEKTRLFARELVERNAAIRAAWDRGEKMRPEILLASQAKFDAEFTSILTPEQRRKYEQDWKSLVLKGRRVQPGF